MKAGFRYIERGSEATFVCLQGWGFTGDLFLHLPPPLSSSNLVIHPGLLTGSEVGWLMDFLSELQSGKMGRRLILLGWSLGARMAAELAAAAEDLSISGCALICFSTGYERSYMEELKSQISKDAIRTLRNFHLKCFWGDKKGYRRFKTELQQKILEKIDPDHLSRGLDYLSMPFAPAAGATDRRTAHGLFVWCSRDIVADESQTRRWSKGPEAAAIFADIKRVRIDAPHFPFYSPHLYHELSTL